MDSSGFEATDRGREVAFDAAGDEVQATLGLPKRAPRGLVLFAHARARSSAPERLAARVLRDAGFATLLADLGPRETSAGTPEGLAARLGDAVDAAARLPEARNLALGVFGVGSGAAAALALAAERPGDVAAVVGAGGSEALDDAPLERVRAPTLLLVGERDGARAAAARDAFRRLDATKELEVLPGVARIDETPAALDEVARRAAEWFAQTLGAKRSPEGAARGGRAR